MKARGGRSGRMEAVLGIGLLFTPRVLGADGAFPGGPPGASAQQYGWSIGLVVTLCLAGIAVITTVLAVRIDARRHPARGLSPEQVISYRGTGEDPTRPEVLYRLITERLARIRRALQDSPSEVEVEMCTLGYQSCADDAITLLHIIDEESPGSGPLRRLRLGRIRRKTLIALSRTREVLPAHALRCSRGDSLNGGLP